MSLEFGKDTGFAISTDGVGVFGAPERIEDLWPFVLEKTNFFGFELVAWNGRVENSLNKIKVAGIHGRLGVRSGALSTTKFIELGLNAELMPTKQLIKFAKEALYVLFHTPEAQKNQQLIVDNRFQLNFVFVENTLDQDSLDKTLTLVESLRNQEVNAAVMIDIGHLLCQLSSLDNIPKEKEQFNLLWNEAKQRIKFIQPRLVNIPFGFHIPIGGTFDCLPIEKMIEWNLLTGLSQLVHGNGLKPIITVIENPTAGISLIRVPENKVLGQRQWNQKMFEALVVSGVINRG